MDLVTDKFIEDKIELNYLRKQIQLSGRYKITLIYKGKVADGTEKIPKFMLKIKQMRTDVLLKIFFFFFANLNSYP